MTETSRYLLALYVAEQHGTAPVPSGDVADAVGRSPSATTEMLQRLEDRGLVSREPYRGATLTVDGRDTAEDLYRTYATLSRFFHEVLGLDDYREEAMRLAGNVSPTVADRLSGTLLQSAPDDEPPSIPRWSGPDSRSRSPRTASFLLLGDPKQPR